MLCLSPLARKRGSNKGEMKIQFSEEDSNDEKNRQKEKKKITSSKEMHLVTMVMGVLLIDFEDQIKDRLLWRKSLYMVAKN